MIHFFRLRRLQQSWLRRFQFLQFRLWRRLWPRRLSLRTILIAPFALQLTIAIVIVAAISFHQGRMAVGLTISKLQLELANRISDELAHYLEDAHTATQLSADEIALGHLKLNDRDSVRQYLFRQMQRFNQLGYTAIATESGSYVGIGRIGDGSELLLDWFGDTGFFEKWQLDPHGQPINRVQIREDYDARTRPWYRAAVKRGDAAWSEVFQYFGSRQPVMSANRPLLDSSGQLIGVVSADLRLEQIGDFLNTLEIGKTGEAFVVDRLGHTLGSSTPEVAYRRDSPLIEATASSLPLVRETSQQLLERYHGFPQVPSQQTLKIEGDRVLVQTLPYHDPRGLDWTIVVVVPERDFMAPIFAMSHNAIRISVLALGVAIVGGIITARGIADPIHALAKASRTLASNFDHGDTEDAPAVPPQTIHELHLLATAFAQMAVRLRSSFQQLELINHDLEDRVQARTRELQLANHELQRLASIDGLTQLANRRCFDEYFTTCWQDARDRAQPLTIALCDIDHFKQFNDTYGHQAGDDCLKQVAQAIEQAVIDVATGDLAGGGRALAARYGGEEFVILLPEADAEQARRVIEAVQAEVNYLAIPHARSSATHIVSLSLGIAVIMPGTIAAPNQALVMADQALYAAKRAGRNRYCFAPTLEQSDQPQAKPTPTWADPVDLPLDV